MADRTVDPIIVPFSVTTPAGTAIANPIFTTVPVPRGRLSAVEVQIPPGHAGQTGLRLELARQQIIPFSTAASWLLGDDYTHDFPTDVEVDQGLRVATYNTGQYDHTHYLRLTVWKIAPAAGATLRAVPNMIGMQAS